MSSNRIKDQMKLESMHRRQFGSVAMGVLAVAGLAACGGGGGSDEGDEYPLRQAYDQVNLGMTKQDVLSIIGRSPEGDDGGIWAYRSERESLTVYYGPYEGMTGVRVNGVTWNTNMRSPEISLHK